MRRRSRSRSRRCRACCPRLSTPAGSDPPRDRPRRSSASRPRREASHTPPRCPPDGRTESIMNLYLRPARATSVHATYPVPTRAPMAHGLPCRRGQRRRCHGGPVAAQGRQGLRRQGGRPHGVGGCGPTTRSVATCIGEGGPGGPTGSASASPSSCTAAAQTRVPRPRPSRRGAVQRGAARTWGPTARTKGAREWRGAAVAGTRRWPHLLEVHVLARLLELVVAEADPVVAVGARDHALGVSLGRGREQEAENVHHALALWRHARGGGDGVAHGRKVAGWGADEPGPSGSRQR